jgi:hypothetical protein
MQTQERLSGLLQKMVQQNVIPEKIALKLNQLPTTALQLQALKELSAVTSEAVDGLVDRLSGKGTKVLYDSRAAEPAHSTMAQAVGDDLLNKFFPYLGNVGRVIQERIRKSWASGNTQRWLKWSVIVWLVAFLWSPIVWLARSPFTLSRRLSEFRLPSSATTDGGSRKPELGTLNSELGRRNPPLPVLRPVQASASIVSATPVAQVNVRTAPLAPKKSRLGEFAKQLIKNTDGVVASTVRITPLAEGINATKHAALETLAQPATEAVPIPEGLSVEMLSASQAKVIWTRHAGNLTYNLYSSRAQDMVDAHKENTHPVRNTTVVWWSDTGPGVYYLALTASDEAGHESLYSDPVEVTVR